MTEGLDVAATDITDLEMGKEDVCHELEEARVAWDCLTRPEDDVPSKSMRTTILNPVPGMIDQVSPQLRHVIAIREDVQVHNGTGATQILLQVLTCLRCCCRRLKFGLHTRSYHHTT